jgi:hypothetical protein
MNKLKTLIERFREAFHVPTVPFVAGEIGYFKTDKPLINDVINQLPKEVKYTAVVSAAGLKDKGDSTHFDAPSARELGRRYAEAMYKLQHP